MPAAHSRPPFARLWRNAGWYGLGDGLLRGIHTLLEPVLTRLLTPAQMGIWGTATVLLVALPPVLSLSLAQAVSRRWLDTGDGTRPALVRRSLGLQLAVVAATTALVAAAALGLEAVGWTLLAWWPWLLLVLVTSAAEGWLLLPRALLTTMERAPAVVGLAALSTGLFLGLGGVLAAAGVPVLLALMVGRSAGAVAAVGVGGWHLRGDGAQSPAPEAEAWTLVRQGLPWIPHLLSHALLRLGDRWVVGGLLGLPAVGLYTGVWFFADAVGLVSGSLNRALAPHYARLRGDVSRHGYLRRMHALYAWLVQSAVVGACALAPWTVRTLFGEAWHTEAPVAAWTALSGLPLAMYFPAASRAFVGELAGRTGHWTVGSAVLNVVLNLLWVPSLGLTGAALASVVAYGVLWAGVAWTARGVDPGIHGGSLRWAAAAGAAVCGVVAWSAATDAAPVWVTLAVGLGVVAGVWGAVRMGLDRREHP